MKISSKNTNYWQLKWDSINMELKKSVAVKPHCVLKQSDGRLEDPAVYRGR